MTTLPASGYWENNVRTEGEGKQWGEDIRDVVAELLGGSATGMLTIAAGVVVPTLASHTIEGQGAASDDLTNITTTNTPDGRLLLLSAYHTDHTITVKDAAGGAGQIHMLGNADVDLDETLKWILLLRTGTDWYEVMRSHHAALHERAGVAEIDGDHLDIDYTPTYSIPATTPAEAASVDDLAAHLFGVDALFGHFAKGCVQRSIFTYNGGAAAYTIKVKPGVYWCKDKLCQWITELTTDAISTPAADDWYYLYLNYSGITNGTTIIASKLIWSNTEPVWNDTYMGWYNGDDKCIFAALTNSGPTNILEFFHDGGDYVSKADCSIDRALADLNATWADVTLVIPSYAIKAQCSFYGSAAADADLASGYWRTKGQSGTTGHYIYYIDADVAYYALNALEVLTDSSQKIEVKHSVIGSHQMSVMTNGWYFPIGI